MALSNFDTPSVLYYIFSRFNRLIMTLSFKNKIGKDLTFFVQRIWLGLKFESSVYDEFYKNCILTTGNNWDIASSLKMPKIHTIRKDAFNRWRVNMIIHFVINNRTPKRFQFAPLLPVLSIQQIKIHYIGFPSSGYKIRVLIDNNLFYQEGSPVDRGMLQLAINDGFNSVEDFFKYFSSDFEGKIIHWTDFEYSFR